MLLREKPWDKNLQLLLASVVGFNVIPHVWTVPIWVTSMALFCVAWKFLYLTRGVQFPKRWLLWTAAAVASAGIAATYYDSFSQETSSALLVIMASLKLLETNRYRDAMLVIFTSYFLLMSYLLESQSLPTTVFMVVDVFLITALMYQVHRRDGKSGLPNFRPVLRQLALIVPMWIFLFIAFPRFTTGLWNFRSPQAGTGFSDELNPGAIDRLVDSDEIAFRADFKNINLSPVSLYWRGAILTEGNGLKWAKAKIALEPDLILDENEQTKASLRSVSYEVFLEPGMSNWMFAIDIPSSISSSDTFFLQQIRKRPGFIYQTARPIGSRVEYRLTSRLSPPPQVLSRGDQAQTLRIPAKLSSDVKALAKEIYATAQNDPRYSEFKTPEEKAAREMMLWFAKQNFRYSKTPGMLLSTDGAEQLDEFLFKKKVGFCEHYSAAFATLMRAMNIPARVVVGFQGGTHNEFGDYYLVRKMDAHAWAEIWVSDSGNTNTKVAHGRWLRVDPTETIAPLRLQLGGEYYRMDPNTLALGTTGEAIRQGLDKGLARFMRQSQAAWDALQMQWNAFLLLYDLDFQLQLLARLGFANAAPYLLLVLLVLGAVLFAGGLNWALRRRAQKKDPVLEEWRRFCRELERRGIERQPNEGPIAFAKRASTLLPKAESQIRQVAEVFADLRYGSPPQAGGSVKKTATDASPANSLKTFRHLIRQSLRELSSSESSRATTS